MKVNCVPWLAAGTMVCAAGAAAGAERPRVYTNEDLARVSGRRGESGALSQPGVAEPKAETRDRAGANDAREAHWRAEAARVRERLLPLRQELDDRKDELDARRRTPGVKIDDPRARALAKRIALVEARIREVEDRLEERARRAGALPGWLR